MRAFLVVAGLAACAGDSVETELPPLPPRVADVTPTAGAERPLREAVLAFTGEVRGEIESCGCPTVPYGGFARREALLDELRASGVPVFVLDVGQMLVKGEIARDPTGRELRAHTVLDLARAVGLDAWAASRADATVGDGAVLREGGALAANWPGYPGATVIERGGVTLNVIGLADTPLHGEATDAVAAVRAQVRDDVDANVVISSASSEIDVAVAESVPGVGVVLATRGAKTEAPRKTRGALVIETPDRGRYVTILHASLGSDTRAWTLADTGPAAEIGGVRRRVAGKLDNPELQRAVERLREASRGLNLVQVEDRPLGSDLDKDTPVAARIERFKARTRQVVADRVEAPKGPTYAGAGACTSCHSTRMAAWAFDPHARALEPLIKAHKEDDTECVACHTTAYGEPGGFAKLDAASLDAWKGVQCEACHGPSGGHPGATKVSMPTRETCLGCHDAANSPSFDYADYLRRISCSTVSKVDPGRK